MVANTGNNDGSFEEGCKSDRFYSFSFKRDDRGGLQDFCDRDGDNNWNERRGCRPKIHDFVYSVP